MPPMPPNHEVRDNIKSTMNDAFLTTHWVYDRIKNTIQQCMVCSFLLYTWSLGIGSKYTFPCIFFQPSFSVTNISKID